MPWMIPLRNAQEKSQVIHQENFANDYLKNAIEDFSKTPK